MLNNGFQKGKQQIEYFCLTQVVKDDLKNLGFNFSWQKLDAQSFLLRQRRTRVWGVADVMNDVSQQDLHTGMKRSIDSMSSTDLMEFETVFDTSLPKQKLTNNRQKNKLAQAVAKARLKDGDADTIPNVFMDLASGKDRDAESAENVSTCVRPSHQIYSNALGRTLSARELWHCQGLFESAFQNPQAITDIMQNHTQAQDLAGQQEQQVCILCLNNIFKSDRNLTDRIFN